MWYTIGAIEPKDYRTVYKHKKYDRLYVQSIGSLDENLKLFKTRSKKKAKDVLDAVNKHWNNKFKIVQYEE